MSNATVPLGFCHCGCGQKTRIAPQTRPDLGWVKGRPIRFINGHNKRKHGLPPGQSLARGGYIRVHVPDHPASNSRGYALEHRLVAERALGRPLPDTAVVHHVNGDPADNRPGNLVICEDHAYHALLHARQRAIEECGHAEWLYCHICKEWSPGDDMYIGERTRYHRACARAREARRSA